MVLDVVVVLLVVLITLYLATQGMLSSLLALATSTFASILAMGLMEPLEGVIGGWRPEYARGLTFLLLFLLIFTAARLAADAAVPKNIKLPVVVNRLAGGAAGFFAGLVVVGTLLVGIEMLPVGRTPLGFERFPGEMGMQAVGRDGKPEYGEAAAPANVWLAPDRFVLAIWDGASGRSLGGAREWASAHPDMSVEAYGYRNQIDGSMRVLPANLLTVQGAWINDGWTSEDSKIKDTPAGHLPAQSGAKLVIVRTEVKKGSQAPDISSDNDGYLRVSASQVRLVTSMEKQYYPIGYLEWGRQFVPLTLNTGFIADEYVNGDNTVEDWVFRVPEDETPAYFEMKQLGRADLSGLLTKEPVKALAQGAYPAHGYLNELSSVSVMFVPRVDSVLRAGKVYVLKPEGIRTDVNTTLLRDAHEHNLDCLRMITDGRGGWSAEGRPGVPSQGMYQVAVGDGQRILTDQDTAPVAWSSVITVLLLGQGQADADLNLRAMPNFFNSKIVKMWKEAGKGSLIVASGEADPDKGKVELTKINAGRHVLVVTMLTDTAYYVWVTERNLPKKGRVEFKAAAQGATESPLVEVDKEGKI